LVFTPHAHTGTVILVLLLPFAISIRFRLEKIYIYICRYVFHSWANTQAHLHMCSTQALHWCACKLGFGFLVAFSIRISQWLQQPPLTFHFPPRFSFIIFTIHFHIDWIFDIYTLHKNTPADFILQKKRFHFVSSGTAVIPFKYTVRL